MNCTICGFDNPADGRFCKKCGAALIVPPPQARAAGDLAGASPAAEPAAAASMDVAPATGGGIPKPYIVIAVIALLILAGAWAAWRSLGDGGAPADSNTPTAVAPANDTTPGESTSGNVAAPATGADTTPASAATSAEPPPASDAVAPAGNAADTNAAAAPVIAAPAVVPPAPKTAHKAPAKAPVIAAPKQAAPAPSTAVAPAPRAAPAAPRRDRWAVMADEMTACGRGNNFIEKVVCEQKVRYKYCDGYWGKVPQCPTAPPKDTGG